MRRLFLSLGLLALVFCVACGSGSNAVTGFIPKGPFSNANLKGQYVYQISGLDFTVNPNGVPYREAGVFAANGGGQITGGTDDFVEGNGVVATNPATGTYVVNNDGTGGITLNVGTSTLTFAITMVSSSKVYLIEADSGVNSSGIAEEQVATAITSVPAGTFVFHTHNLNASQVPTGLTGVITITGVAVTSGSEDSLTLGATSTPLTLTSGSFTTPDAFGRGRLTLTDSTPATSHYNYYIVDANNLRFFDSDLGIMGLGRAEKQTGTLALSGSYAFGSQGDTNSFGLGGVDSVGRFTSDGTSAISGGALDRVQDGNHLAPIPTTFTGSFTPLSSNGRTQLSLSDSDQFIVWMVSSSRGFFFVNAANKVEEGTLDLQLTSPFSNSTATGQFALVMNGFDLIAGVNLDRVGTLQWDGNGHWTLNETANSGLGAQSPGPLAGNYSVAANGRVAGTINSLSENSNDLIFYLISGSDAYVLENDASVQINGTISKQPQ
jgi:hypothetical protein